MRCPRCGKQINSDMLVCPICNTVIQPTDQDQIFQNQQGYDQPILINQSANIQHLTTQPNQTSEAKFWKNSRIIWAVLVSLLVVTGIVILILTLMSKSKLIGKWKLISIDGTPTSEEIIWEFSDDGVLTEYDADKTLTYNYSIEHKSICVENSRGDGTDGYFTIEEQSSTLLKVKGEMVLVFEKI